MSAPIGETRWREFGSTWETLSRYFTQILNLHLRQQGFYESL
jgi:hypothetical protein